jgi:hypothetical protein
MWQNAVAVLQGYDPERPLTDGVFVSTAIGSILGGGVGVVGQGAGGMARAVRLDTLREGGRGSAGGVIEAGGSAGRRDADSRDAGPGTAFAKLLAGRTRAERAAKTPGTKQVRFRPNPFGDDLLDHIVASGGVPRRAATKRRGGEVDGWQAVFGSPSGRLLIGRSKNIDTWLEDFNGTHGYRFASPDDFYNAVDLAFEQRKRANAAFARMERQDAFYAAAEKRPSKAEILRLFEEMFIAEIERRGLVRLSEVKAEALAVMEWWQGNPNVSPYYTRSAAETYAEVFSAIMNNLAGVARRAPKLWKLWNNYMMNRPKAAQMYQKIQDSIRSGSYKKERTESLLDMWRRHEEAADLLTNTWRNQPLKKILKNLWRLFDTMLIRQTGPAQREAFARLKRIAGDKVSQDLLRDMKAVLYRQTRWEAFARDLALNVEKPMFETGMDRDDLALYMFHSRIANSPERQGVANTDGFSPKTSRDELLAMRQRLGERRFAMLEEMHQTLRNVYVRQVLKPLIEADLLSPEKRSGRRAR